MSLGFSGTFRVKAGTVFRKRKKKKDGSRRLREMDESPTHTFVELVELLNITQLTSTFDLKLNV